MRRVGAHLSHGKSWTFYGQQRFNTVSRHKVQGHAVDAIPQSRRWWSIFEDMPEVASTSVADDLHPSHAMTQIHPFIDALGSRGLIEAGPATAALEFGPRIEELRPTSHAHVDAIFFVEPELTREAWLGALFTQNSVRIWAQNATPTGRFQAVSWEGCGMVRIGGLGLTTAQGCQNEPSQRQCGVEGSHGC